MTMKGYVYDGPPGNERTHTETVGEAEGTRSRSDENEHKFSSHHSISCFFLEPLSILRVLQLLLNPLNLTQKRAQLLKSKENCQNPVSE